MEKIDERDFNKLLAHIDLPRQRDLCEMKKRDENQSEVLEMKR